MVSLVLVTSIIGCQKTTASATRKSLTMTATTIAPPTTATQTPTFTPLVRVSPVAYEQQYLQSAITLGLTTTSAAVTVNSWVVKVVRVGYFSASSSGNTINYLRIDMQVTSLNTMGFARVFSGFGSLTVSSHNAQYQFDPADSTLVIADRSFDPDSPVTGYWIFQVQGTLDPLNTAQLAFTGGNNSGDTWLFQL